VRASAMIATPKGRPVVLRKCLKRQGRTVSRPAGLAPRRYRVLDTARNPMTAGEPLRCRLGFRVQSHQAVGSRGSLSDLKRSMSLVAASCEPVGRPSIPRMAGAAAGGFGRAGTAGGSHNEDVPPAELAKRPQASLEK
jgi:hypothetical protein